MELFIGDFVAIKNEPGQVARQIVEIKIEETGRLIYKLDKNGYFYPEDLVLSPQIPNKHNGGEKKTILVTGGAGYVGSVLVRKLLQKDYRVICVDILRFGGQSLLDVWGNPDFLFKKIDITDFQAVDEIIDEYQIDSIVHLAAIVGDPACKLEPELAERTNYDASMHLLDKSLQAKINKFVFASTCSNYGKMKDPDNFVDETSPLYPVSLYAQLKVGFENYLLNETGRTDWFSPTALRFSTVYGMSPRMRFDLTVNEFTREVALGRELVIFGENFWRPYCHVSDFSRAILAVLEAPKVKVAYNVFNVGDTSQNFTKKMIAEELIRQSPEAKIRYVKQLEDPRDYRVNFNKIRDTLNFRISKTVPEGICEILECIRQGIIENPDDQRYSNVPVVKDKIA